MQLFGVMSLLPPFEGSVSFIIIIVAVLTVEEIFRRLQTFTEDTPFQGMVTSIEKELMTVGLMAFIFKLITQSTDVIPHNWLLSLEYADLLVPITSFLFCIQGLFLIILSIKQCDIWSKAYHLHLYEVLDEFYDQMKYLSHRMSWLPISVLNNELEFRIHHCIFCDKYDIQKSFAFDTYVQKCYLKFLNELIGIEIVDWFVICVLCLLNWARVELGLEYSTCDHLLHAKDHRMLELSELRELVNRQLGGGGATDDITALPNYYVECIQRSTLKLYTGLGYIIFILCIIVAIFARRTELMIFATRGINSNVDYPTYLIHTEGAQIMDDEADKKKSGVESKRLSSSELKSTIQSAMDEVSKKMHNQAHHSYRKRIPTIIYGHFIMLKTHIMTCLLNFINRSSNKRIRRDSVEQDHDASLQHIKIKHKVKESVKQRSQLNKEKEIIHTLKSMKKNIKHEEKEHIASITVQTHSAHSRFAENSEDHNVWSHVNNYFHPNSPHTSAAPDGGQHGSDNVESLEALSSSRSELAMKKSVDDISSAYFYSHPALFFDFVEALNMVVSFYLALWFTNFGSACYQTPYVANWMVASIAPGLICFVIYLYIVRTAALLKSITFFDSDVAKETIEEAEDIESLGEQLRERLNKKLTEIGGKHEQELKILFRQADDDGSMCLSRSEFQVMMEALDITYSKKRWAQIFKEIDRNFDDNISFEEFFLFIYPKNDNAIAAERKRLKIVRERVRSKSIVADRNSKESIANVIPQTFRQAATSSASSFDKSKIVALCEDVSYNSYNSSREGNVDTSDSARDAAQSTTVTMSLVDIEDGNNLEEIA